MIGSSRLTTGKVEVVGPLEACTAAEGASAVAEDEEAFLSVEEADTSSSSSTASLVLDTSAPRCLSRWFLRCQCRCQEWPLSDSSSKLDCQCHLRKCSRDSGTSTKRSTQSAQLKMRKMTS